MLRVLLRLGIAALQHLLGHDQPVLLDQRRQEVHHPPLLLLADPLLLDRHPVDLRHYRLQQGCKHAVAKVGFGLHGVDLPVLGALRKHHQHLLFVAGAGAALFEQEDVAVELCHHAPGQLVLAAAGGVDEQAGVPPLLSRQPAAKHLRLEVVPIGAQPHAHQIGVAQLGIVGPHHQLRQGLPIQRQHHQVAEADRIPIGRADPGVQHPLQLPVLAAQPALAAQQLLVIEALRIGGHPHQLWMRLHLRSDQRIEVPLVGAPLVRLAGIRIPAGPEPDGIAPLAHQPPVEACFEVRGALVADLPREHLPHLVGHVEAGRVRCIPVTIGRLDDRLELADRMEQPLHLERCDRVVQGLDVIGHDEGGPFPGQR